MTHDEFNVHCTSLSLIVQCEALRTLYAHGFHDVQPVPNPPSSFTQLRVTYRQAVNGRTGLLPVLGTHCECVIYDTPHINMLYRGWHDLTHIEMDRGFDFESEIAVARHKSLRIPEGPMREIMLADAVGESEFAEATGGKFPLYQRLFAFDYVRWGRDEAIRLHRYDTA
jgi:hypothetical protein